ncbi:MAG: SDR family NAD(P)-dependent oxidoreductase [bacterium]|nr:SDR family NAD(P)-dependent oxidoreductase [bacterium]
MSPGSGAIVVTGASRGLGRRVAKDLVADGATVVAVARGQDDLQTLLAESSDLPGQLHVQSGDVCNLEWFESMLDEVESSVEIEGLVANAGVNPIMRTAVNTSPEAFDHIMNVNVRATFFCSTAVIRRLSLRGKGGAVVIVGSMGSDVPIPGNSVYCLSKAATVQMAKVLALESAKDAIRVNVVSPGFLATDLTAAIRADTAKMESLEGATPLGRVGTVEEASAAVRFLLSSEAGYATGAVLTIDGGFSLVPGWPPAGRTPNK